MVIKTSSKKMFTRIEAPKQWEAIDFSGYWQRRNLIIYLTLREIKAMLTHTYFGIFWVVAPPIITAILMIIVLGKLAKIPTGDLPYSLVVLSGMLPWVYFSNAVTKASSSMNANAYLLTKVYFPKLIIPTVPIIAELITLFSMMLVLFLALFYYRIEPQLSWALIIIPMLLNIFLTMGFSIWLSALNVRVPDIAKITPILLQVLAYASPIYYPRSLIPEKWHWLYDLNPVVGIVELMRWALFKSENFPYYSVSITVFLAVFLVVSGIFIFRHIEDTAADFV